MARKAGGGKSITITGLRGVNRALKALPPAVAKKVIRQSVRQALKPVRDAVKQEAPVDTGVLIKAIKVRAGKRKKDRISMAVRIGKGDFVGDQYYAAFQEFGTKKIKANPFMHRAFEHTAEKAKRDGERLIRDGVNTQVKALKSKGD